ncbi:MAG: long-chain fatty acid--CoA ligase [Thaumarchaeota archaeon]|nr:long-chain fatty acid--CoA ligase [Nitrososphaerota archaeon]
MEIERPWARVQAQATIPMGPAENKPLHSLLRDSARAHPDFPCISYGGRTLSYKGTDDLASKFASALGGLGVRKGDRVAIFLPNVPQFVIAYFGILEAGAVVVACNPLYKPGELEHQLRDSGSDVVIASKDIVRGTDLYASLEVSRPDLPLRHVVTTSVTDFLPGLKRSLSGLAGVKRKDRKDTLDFVALIDSAKPVEPVAVDPLRDLAILQYTGGTTGISKGAMLTHFNVYSMTVRGTSFLPLSEKDVFLAVLPLFHVYGGVANLTIPVYVGARILLLPRFHVEEVMKTVQRQKATIFCGVPAMYIAINSNPKATKFDLRSVRVCVSGGSALPAAARRRFIELTGGKLVEGYGLSETSALTHCNPVVSGEVKDGSVGIPFPETDAAVVGVDDPDSFLPVGSVGEIVVRGPQVMSGYWNQPGETKSAFHNGWFLTGDIGKMDEDGYFYILDRKKDMINVAGEKVYPRDVEEVLFEHPSIRDAAVVGMPDSFSGEAVKAFVVLKGGAKPTSERNVIAFCAEKIAKYKVPKSVEFVSEIPKSLPGKVLKRVLRETRPRQS